MKKSFKFMIYDNFRHLLSLQSLICYLLKCLMNMNVLPFPKESNISDCVI